MKKKFFLSLIIIMSMIFISIFVYSKINYQQLDREKVESLVDKDFVDVNNYRNSIVIKPKGRDGCVGYIFYPQNNVDEASYIPVMAEIAQRGFNVYIMETSLHKNLNTNSIGRDIIVLNPSITNWVIGGVKEGENSAINLYNKIKDNKKAELLLCNDLIQLKYDDIYYCDRNMKEELKENSRIILESINKLRN
ncbi:MAG: alpha/beta hydrolase [Clostridium sp.]|uniref:alpha/beta hydrolase n=1 Tax=Clostridium sp. TaxID=1506 RepID=UPI003F340327